MRPFAMIFLNSSAGGVRKPTGATWLALRHAKMPTADVSANIGWRTLENLG